MVPFGQSASWVASSFDTQCHILGQLLMMNLFFLRSWRVRRSTWLCLLSFVVGIVPTSQAASGKPRYGRRGRFALNREIAFPDFSLRYIGRTHVDSAVFRLGFTYENFVVAADGNEQTVPWTAGTGIIAPVEFKVGAKRFLLELHHSARLGVLAPHEVVIAPASEP